MHVQSAFVALLLPALAACGAADAQSQQNILVDPAGGVMDGYRTVARLADVPFAALAPGSSVLVRGGSYGDVAVISARGSVDAPVTVLARM
jgi:hypothetical protein